MPASQIPLVGSLLPDEPPCLVCRTTAVRPDPRPSQPDRELTEVISISQEALARQADFAGDMGLDIRLGDVVVGIGGKSVEGQGFEEVVHHLAAASRPTKVLFARAVKQITHAFRKREWW